MATRAFFVRGELDIATVRCFQDELLALVRSDSGDVIVDCSALSFIDASGISALVRARSLLAEEGRDLHVVNARGLATRVFDLLGLTEVLHVRDVPQQPTTSVLQLCAREARYRRPRLERPADRALGDA